MLERPWGNPISPRSCLLEKTHCSHVEVRQVTVNEPHLAPITTKNHSPISKPFTRTPATYLSQGELDCAALVLVQQPEQF